MQMKGIVSMIVLAAVLTGARLHAGAPANDVFASPTVIGPALPVTAIGNNVGATKEVGEPDHAADTGGASVWFSFTPGTSTTVTVSTGGSSFDTVLAIYTGSAVNALTEVASNDDAPIGDGTSQATFAAVAGTTYSIAIDGVDSGAGADTGTIQLRLAVPPGNDSFATPTVLASALPVTVTGTNVDATKEAVEPNHAGDPGGASVWFSFTPSTSATVLVSTSGSSFDTLLAVYTGSSINALTLVAANDDNPNGDVTSLISFAAVAGTAYAIAVDGLGAEMGAIQLSIVENTAPGNDLFTNAVILPATVPQTLTPSGTNVAATKESGEPAHAGNTGGASIWFVFTPNTSARLAVSTAGSNFDTLLAVYSGASVSALTEIDSSDDALGQLTSRVVFSAIAGQSYRIAVDGFDGETGNVMLSIDTAPPVDLVVQSMTVSPEISNPGGTVVFTVTILNSGAGNADSFNVSFFGDRATAPTPAAKDASVPDQSVTSLPAGQTAEVLFAVTAPTVGTRTAWVFIDALGLVEETDETNNAGPLPAGLSWSVVVPPPPPPAITSATAAAATVGTPFTYSITATNSPTGFDAAGLPDGLAIDKATGLISGTPTIAGTATVQLSAANAGGEGNASLAITIAKAPAVIPPLPAADGTADQPFMYAIVATGTPPFTYSTSPLPEGLSLSGNLIQGTPKTPGTYFVTVTADNASGTIGMNNLVFTIANSPLNIDNDAFPNDIDIDDDGDGYLDEIEVALNTNPLDAKDTPNGGVPASPRPLSISALSIKLNFTATGRDGIGIAGFVENPNTVVANSKILLDVGGVIAQFTLDGKGGARAGSNSFKLSKKGDIVKFSAKLVKGDFRAALDAAGLKNESVRGKVKRVNATLIIGNDLYTRLDLPVLYSATEDRSGSAKALETESAPSGRTPGQ